MFFVSTWRLVPACSSRASSIAAVMNCWCEPPEGTASIASNSAITGANLSFDWSIVGIDRTGREVRAMCQQQ
jgi:hypothetical protein